MFKKGKYLLLSILLVIFLSIIVVNAQEATIDQEGGTLIILESVNPGLTNEEVSKNAEILKSCLNELGFLESRVRRLGKTRILIELPITNLDTRKKIFDFINKFVQVVIYTVEMLGPVIEGDSMAQVPMNEEEIVAKEKEEPSTVSIEALEEEVIEVSSSENYFPLDKGRRWEYQILSKEGGGWEGILGESKTSGKVIVTNFPQRELKGEIVTPQQVEYKAWGSISTSFWFYIEDQGGVYEFAYQKPEDIEPKIIHDYIIKYPIKVGNIWQETETSAFKPEISIPVESTIESINEVVTVPAGTFEDCLKIKTVGFAEKVTGKWLGEEEKVRIDREWYKWFAPGVGLIKEIFKEKKTQTGGIGSPPVPEFKEITVQLETFK